jgi:hypothetical protein
MDASQTCEVLHVFDAFNAPIFQPFVFVDPFLFAGLPLVACIELNRFLSKNHQYLLHVA